MRAPRIRSSTLGGLDSEPARIGVGGDPASRELSELAGNGAGRRSRSGFGEKGSEAVDPVLLQSESGPSCAHGLGRADGAGEGDRRLGGRDLALVRLGRPPGPGRDLAPGPV